jgi:hypothetical protein
MRLADYRPIHCTSILKLMDRAGVNLMQLRHDVMAQFGECFVSYPDGSLVIDSCAAGNAFFERGAKLAFDRIYRDDEHKHGADTGPLKTSLAYARISSLKPFTPAVYQVHFADESVRKVDGGVVGIVAGSNCGTLTEAPLDELLISVDFMRDLTEKNCAAFAAQMRNCLQSLSERGFQDEGPIRPFPDIHFAKRLAQLRVDASKSGPISINWIITRIVSFIPYCPLSCIHFTLQCLKYDQNGSPRFRVVDFAEAYGGITVSLRVW